MVTVIVVLVYFVQARVEQLAVKSEAPGSMNKLASALAFESASKAQNSLDRLVDELVLNLFDWALEVFPLCQADLGNTALWKPRHLASPHHISSRPPLQLQACQSSSAFHEEQVKQSHHQPGSDQFVPNDRFNRIKTIGEPQISSLGKSIPAIGKQQYDPILDWKFPSKEKIRQTIERQVRPARALTSPVFFSTAEDGQRSRGLGLLPSVQNGKPLLFVANHQLFGLDLGMIWAELMEERGIVARGLAHPIIFQSRPRNRQGPTKSNGNFAGGNRQDLNNFSSTLQTFGAVMVTPRNYYRLMKTGQTGLLFPGGVREVYHGKNDAYRLFWPESTDFVRTAAKFNATIVPLSAVGAADSVEILFDAQDMLALPFGLGERALSTARNTVSARVGDSDELFLPPFALPRLPARHYFLFGRPMSTDILDPQNRDDCNAFYNKVKMELEQGIQDLLRARKDDPFADATRRLAYERVTGKTAPTFPVDELNSPSKR